MELPYYSTIIENMYISRKWKLVKDFEKLSLEHLNQVITEAFNSLQNKSHIIDSTDIKYFHLLTAFIKANIPFEPKEILLDMYLSKNWNPHKSLLHLKNGELNELFLEQIINLQDEKPDFDNDEFMNLCLYIKSHNTN